MRKLVIALVGRPNVGKSTLFNRLSGERLAVVDDIPGTTRDRLVAEAEWRGINFDIVDTGGIDPTHLGRATPLSIGSADYIEEIKVQAQQAARDADGIILLVDGESGLQQLNSMSLVWGNPIPSLHCMEPVSEIC
jgi:GTP-binding protein